MYLLININIKNVGIQEKHTYVADIHISIKITVNVNNHVVNFHDLITCYILANY